MPTRTPHASRGISWINAGTPGPNAALPPTNTAPLNRPSPSHFPFRAHGISWFSSHGIFWINALRHSLHRHLIPPSRPPASVHPLRPLDPAPPVHLRTRWIRLTPEGGPTAPSYFADPDLPTGSYYRLPPYLTLLQHPGPGSDQIGKGSPASSSKDESNKSPQLTLTAPPNPPPTANRGSRTAVSSGPGSGPGLGVTGCRSPWGGDEERGASMGVAKRSGPGLGVTGRRSPRDGDEKRGASMGVAKGDGGVWGFGGEGVRDGGR
ncbi:hypothetical protein GCM10027589_28630 [Actinocorallia lasiicapitis]